VLHTLGQGQLDLHDPLADNVFLDTRCLPKPATGEQARYILKQLAESSRPFGTAVEVKGESAEMNLKAGTAP
jgi:predicted house-cleaning NTP pyrophosphatase (Maf/HAM1 superfamily)